LVRKLCPYCKCAMRVEGNEYFCLDSKYLENEAQVVYRPIGCSKCKGGYLGRTVIAEVMLIDEEIEDLINNNRLGDIFPLLKRRGTYKSMVDDIKTLILDGETSIEEAVRVLG